MSTTEPAAGVGHNKPPLAEILEERTRAIRKEIADIATKANEWPKDGRGALVKIATEDDLARAADLVKGVRAIARRAEDMRKVEKEPHLAAGREVDGFFGALTARLDRIDQAFQALADNHAREKAAEERKRREDEAAKLRAEEEKKRAEAEAARRAATRGRKSEEADDIAERAADAEAFAAAPAAELVATTVTSSGVKAAAKTEWTHEITDLAKVDLEPLRYLIKRDAIEAAVRQFVKNGGRSLGGVRIFEDVRAAIR